MGPSLEHRTVPSAANIEDHPFRRHIDADLDRSLIDNAARYGNEFLTSTSGWNLRHLIAFRMLDFNDIPIEYMYPRKFYPAADDPVISNVQKMFTLSQEDVQRGVFTPTQTGAAFIFYRTLRECIRTQHKTPSPQQTSSRPIRSVQVQTSHEQTLSGSSGSSFLPSMMSMPDITAQPLTQDKSEIVTNTLLTTLLYLFEELENEAAGGKSVMFRFLNIILTLIRFSPHQDHFTMVLQGWTFSSENDGAAWKCRWSTTSGQWVKSGAVPLLSLEVIYHRPDG